MLSFQDHLNKSGEFGIIEEIHHPLAIVSGLPNVKLREVVIIDNGVRAIVFSLRQDTAELLVFSTTPPRVGQHVTRTGEKASINTDSSMLGRILTPLGTPITAEENPIQVGERRLIDVKPLGITQRKTIHTHLATGVSVTDTLLPLGKGQRQLIAGDRKTGKTSFALSVMKSQIQNGSIAVYVAIGKKSNETKQILEFLKQNKISHGAIIVSTSPQDPHTLLYLAPFTGMTIAEYFRDTGRDVLLVLDDLSTHAQIYREISLLAKRFPGKDSYPGDVFYTHARLLERGGNFKNNDPNKSVSITCLPIVETTGSDLTDYIVSNLIGITDGHILFDSNEFAQGRRPAINLPLSVTRVGRQTQTRTLQELNHKLVSVLSKYNKASTFARFGQELSKETQKDIDTGEKLYAFYNQPTGNIIPLQLQVVFTVMILEELFSGDTVLINQYRDEAIAKYQSDPATAELINQTAKGKSLHELNRNINQRKDELLKICQP